MDINSQHHNLLGNQISPKSEDFVFWWPFWIQNGCNSKPTMNINSQHHNLLGNQISPKSKDFSIWRPFCTLITIATAAILIFFNPNGHRCHGNGQNAKKNEKHKNEHSRLLAKQKLMILDRNNIHI
jgi:hypothetical protein